MATRANTVVARTATVQGPQRLWKLENVLCLGSILDLDRITNTHVPKMGAAYDADPSSILYLLKYRAVFCDFTAIYLRCSALCIN
jgi:hypothetical protein